MDVRTPHDIFAVLALFSGVWPRGVHGLVGRECRARGPQDAWCHQALRVCHGHHPRRLLRRVSLTFEHSLAHGSKTSLDTSQEAFVKSIQGKGSANEAR